MTRYAYRLETMRVKEEGFPYGNEVLTSPEAVANFARRLENSDIEKMLVLYLNTKNRLICIQVFSGTIDRAVIHPREILKHALLAGSNAIVLVHNHPSGLPFASPEDMVLTKSIKSACDMLQIRLLDHVIIGEEGKRVSFMEQHLI